MKDFKTLREKMITMQLKPRGIHDPRTLEAMLQVPREVFVPNEYRRYAYEDRPLPIGENQTVSQPFMVALMTQALQLRGDEKVLEIGTGSGYQTAILAAMAKAVYSIERIPSLANKARETLEKLECTNVTVLIGDGTKGDRDHAPFDAIIVTAGSPKTPQPLKNQLSVGGSLVIPVGSMGYQELLRITHGEETDVIENLGGCVFVPLIGNEGWEH